MKRAQNQIFVFLIIGIIALLNVVGMNQFVRLDLTRDRIFTLSDASKTTMKSLEDPVTVTAYFTENLPPPFSSNARYVRDLLEEYRSASKGLVSFEFKDPQSEETAEDKEKKKEIKRDIFGRTLRAPTKIEEELERQGIQPVEIRVVEDDQAQTKRAYMGIVIRYQEKTETIPVVQATDTLEYDLTTMIRRLTRTKTPVLGVLQGHGEPNPQQELQRVAQLLSQNYEVRPVTLTAGENGAAMKVPDDVDALLVVGPNQAYSEDEKRAIDSFLMLGKSAAFFLDRVKVDFRSFEPTTVDNGLADLVSGYGIELGTQLVGDVECASLNVAERRGWMVVQMPVRYPFIPMPRSLIGDSPLTKGISDITLPFAVSLHKNEVAGVEVSALATSSQRGSWLEEPTAENMNPRRDWSNAEVKPTGPYNLIMQAKGKLPSHFAPDKKSESEARIVVIGTSSFLNEQIMGPQNAALLLNIVDWMLLDPQLLAMRSRGLTEAPLNPELSDAARNVVKFGNLFGVPFLLIAYGLVRWRMREGRRMVLKGNPQ